MVTGIHSIQSRGSGEEGVRAGEVEVELGDSRVITNTDVFSGDFPTLAGLFIIPRRVLNDGLGMYVCV